MKAIGIARMKQKRKRTTRGRRAKCRDWISKEGRPNRLRQGLGISVIIEEEGGSCEKLTRHDDFDILNLQNLSHAPIECFHRQRFNTR